LLYASKKGLKVCWQFSYRLHCLGGCIPKGIESYKCLYALSLRKFMSFIQKGIERILNVLY